VAATRRPAFNWYLALCAAVTFALIAWIALAPASNRTSVWVDAAIGFLLAIAFAAAGVLTRPSSTPTARSHIRAALEGATIATVDPPEASPEERGRRAFHDPLTDLANRALLADRLDHALARRGRDQRPVAVLFCDLDDFTVINDTLGHLVGDDLLGGVGDRLRECTRPGDTIARVGGDEFALLLEHANTREAERVARRVLEAMARPFELGSREVFVNVSIGGTVAADGADVAELFRQADIALLGAKGRGKGCYEMFRPPVLERAMEHAAMQGDLSAAILAAAPSAHAARSNDELTVAYQPIFDLQSATVVATEALARWTHPTKGVVVPATFIPVAEQTGDIVALGAAVLHQACLRTRVWQERHQRPLSVSVNVAPLQLADPGFADEVRRILQHTRLAPGHLILELAESTLIDDPHRTITRLHGLKAAGVRLAVDDFGTGYSSLAHLRQLPIDMVKIDQGFVGDLGTSPDAHARVDAMANLARTLGLHVVAVGVETVEQFETVSRLGCQWAQGHFFAPAACPDDMDDLLRLNRMSSRRRSD